MFKYIIKTIKIYPLYFNEGLECIPGENEKVNNNEKVISSIKENREKNFNTSNDTSYQKSCTEETNAKLSIYIDSGEEGENKKLLKKDEILNILSVKSKDIVAQFLVKLNILNFKYIKSLSINFS